MDHPAAYGIEAGEVERISAIITRNGSCLLDEAQLTQLFQCDAGHSRLFILMAILTQERHWSFEFQLSTREVRIAPLSG